MTKQIKIESCADCVKKSDNLADGIFYCDFLSSVGGYGCVNEYIDNNTIHPDCPLPDDDTSVLIKSMKKSLDIEEAMSDIDKQLLDQYSKGWDDGAKDAIKPIVKIQEKYGEKYYKNNVPVFDAFFECWQAIKESIELVRGKE